RADPDRPRPATRARPQRPSPPPEVTASPASRGGGWSVRLLGVAGVVGVVGWDEGAFAGAGDEGPAVVGLEVVVVVTDPVGPVQHGEMGVGPVLPVVVLQERGAGAALDPTGRVQPFQRGLLLGVGPAA